MVGVIRFERRLIMLAHRLKSAAPHQVASERLPLGQALLPWTAAQQFMPFGRPF